MQKTTSKKEFIQVVAPYAEKAAQKIGIPTEWVVQHWGHETGWGGNSDTLINNLAGIEHYDDAASGKAYASLDAFADGYAKVIMGKLYYDGVKKATNVHEFAQALKNGGYATDPNYAYADIWSDASMGDTENILSQVLSGYLPPLSPGGDGTNLMNPDGSDPDAGGGNVVDKVLAKVDQITSGVKLGFFNFLIMGIVIFLLYVVFIQGSMVDSAVKKVVK